MNLEDCPSISRFDGIEKNILLVEYRLSMMLLDVRVINMEVIMMLDTRWSRTVAGQGEEREGTLKISVLGPRKAAALIYP